MQCWKRKRPLNRKVLSRLRLGQMPPGEWYTRQRDTGAGSGRGNNWLVNGGNFESQHFSALKSINDHNPDGLGLAWAIPVDSHMGLSTEPIVVDACWTEDKDFHELAIFVITKFSKHLRSRDLTYLY
jgi:hypothetical protein